jgi:hypothetical protein
MPRRCLTNWVDRFHPCWHNSRARPRVRRAGAKSLTGKDFALEIIYGNGNQSLQRNYFNHVLADKEYRTLTQAWHKHLDSGQPRLHELASDMATIV